MTTLYDNLNHEPVTYTMQPNPCTDNGGEFIPGKLDKNKWIYGSLLSPRARLVTNLETGKIHIVINWDEEISQPFNRAMDAIKAWGSGNYTLTRL